MAVVAFDPRAFRARHPEHAALSDDALRDAFALACLLLDNTDASPVPYEPGRDESRAVLLELLVRHLAELAASDAPPGGLKSAAEGSVSVAFNPPPASGDWWYLQTRPGALFRQALKGYAPGGRYVAAHAAHPWG